MQARDGSGGWAGLAEAIEAGGNVGRAARCDVKLRETVEVLAEEVHVAVLAPLRQPIELSGRDWRHLGEHPKVKGFLGDREAEPDEAIEGALQAAVTPGAGSQAQGAEPVRRSRSRRVRVRATARGAVEAAGCWSGRAAVPSTARCRDDRDRTRLGGLGPMGAARDAGVRGVVSPCMTRPFERPKPLSPSRR